MDKVKGPEPGVPDASAREEGTGSWNKAGSKWLDKRRRQHGKSTLSGDLVDHLKSQCEPELEIGPEDGSSSSSKTSFEV